MSPLSRAVRNLTKNPHIGTDFIYAPKDGGNTIAARGLLRTEDDIGRFNTGQIISESIVLDVLCADISAPLSGDKIKIGSETYEIRSDPMRDVDGLCWQLTLMKT